MNRRDFVKNTATVVGFGVFSPLTGGVRQSQKDLDLIIRDAQILDGSGKPAFAGDIGISDGRIAALGRLTNLRAKRLIAADGLAVAPGFIDVHSHSEDELLFNPNAESKIRQGVTTEIVGQDGSSVAPLNAEMQASMNDVYRNAYGIDVDWTTFHGYFSRLQRQGTAVNVGSMLGQGTLREFVVGREDRPASTAEIRSMKQLVEESLLAGALGVSSGLEYPPGAFASSEELTEICKVMHFSTGIYTTHMRSESDFVLEALEEAIAVARGADISLHISHMKCMGRRNWHKLRQVFSQIEDARRHGLSVTMDRYPYTAYNTSLASLLPVWSRSGSHHEFVARLRDADSSPRIRQETLDKVKMIGSWQAIMITSVSHDKHKHLVGNRISEVTSNNGTDEFEFVRKLLIAEGSGVDICGFAMSERNTNEILKHPLCMVASDASARANTGRLAQSTPHPRTYGTFPRVLAEYVRERKLLDLPEAVRKMTSLPAGRFGLTQRGLLKSGYWADLVMFDPARIADKATFIEPHQYPLGIELVMVNGEIVIEKGEHTGALPGKVLKGVRREQKLQ